MMQQRCKRGDRRPRTEIGGLRYLAVVVLAVVSAACATLSPTSPTEEKVKVVTERAEARWKAVIAKDYDAAYQFMSPAVDRLRRPAASGHPYAA